MTDTRREILSRDRVEDLLRYLGDHLGDHPCDHTLRLTRRWAKSASVDWLELQNGLDANGGFCDCEVVLNLPETALFVTRAPVRFVGAYSWCLPPHFRIPPASTTYRLALFGRAESTDGFHARDDEFLIPAPIGAKPRRRQRQRDHFFIGIDSGMPTPLAFVDKLDPPVSASEFSARVVSSGFEELASFSDKEAHFVLAACSAIGAEEWAGTFFSDVTTIDGRRDELRVHKVIRR